MTIVFIALAVLALDQASKYLCAAWLPTLPNGTFPLIDGVFALSYVENRGAAFGMLEDARAFFIVATVLVCGAVIYFAVKEYKRLPALMKVSLALILSGALGNFIDRVFLGYVRDMLYFELINFPVFNVADSAICIGAALLILDLYFFKGKAYMAQLDERMALGKKKKAPPETQDGGGDGEER